MKINQDVYQLKKTICASQNASQPRRTTSVEEPSNALRTHQTTTAMKLSSLNANQALATTIVSEPQNVFQPKKTLNVERNAFHQLITTSAEVQRNVFQLNQTKTATKTTSFNVYHQLKTTSVLTLHNASLTQATTTASQSLKTQPSHKNVMMVQRWENSLLQFTRKPSSEERLQ